MVQAARDRMRLAVRQRDAGAPRHKDKDKRTVRVVLAGKHQAHQFKARIAGRALGPEFVSVTCSFK